jgi:hypothetical protein
MECRVRIVESPYCIVEREGGRGMERVCGCSEHNEKISALLTRVCTAWQRHAWEQSNVTSKRRELHASKTQHIQELDGLLRSVNCSDKLRKLFG